MANLEKSFEFQTPLNISKKEIITVTVSGKYYPDQCDREYGVNYDIETITDDRGNDLKRAYQICSYIGGRFSEKIDEITTAHIEGLTGYEARQEYGRGTMSDIGEAIAMATKPDPDFIKSLYPNGNTYPAPVHEAHAAMFLGNEKDL